MQAYTVRKPQTTILVVLCIECFAWNADRPNGTIALVLKHVSSLHHGTRLLRKFESRTRGRRLCSGVITQPIQAGANSRVVIM